MTNSFRADGAFAYACGHLMDTVYRIAAHNAPQVADAEDVTQEVFESLLTCRKSFRDEEHLKAWLIRVTINQCKNLYRHPVEPLPDDLPAPAAESSSVLEEVRALGDPYAGAIYLHYYEGYTAAEIGGLLGTGQNTVLSWLRRGREQLKKRMIGGFDDE